MWFVIDERKLHTKKPAMALPIATIIEPVWLP